MQEEGPKLRTLPPIKSDSKPRHEVQSEQPWHRVYAYLLLQGKTVTKCAELLQRDKGHLYSIRNSTYFKELLAELAAVAGEEDVSGLLQSCATDAVLVLSELASNDETPATVRRGAASDLLNQYLKTKAPAEPDKAFDDPKSELEQIENELKVLQEQQK